MDSFYDAPRPPPVQTKLPNILPRPCVPEVSMLCHDKPPRNSWADTNDIGETYQSSQQRKQVHFDHFKDTFQSVPNLESRKEFSMSKSSSAISRSPEIDEFKENLPHENPRLDFNLNGKTFKQIYMANIPNRRLDLSLIELNVPPKAPSVTQFAPVLEEPRCDEVVKEPEDKTPHFNSYRDFKSHHLELKTLKTNREPYNFLKSIENTPHIVVPPVEESLIPKSPTKDVEKWHNSLRQSQPSSSSDEPTFKDLFEIVKRQNEQIMMLQQQVMSLKNTVEARQPEPSHFALNSTQKGRNYPSPKLNLPNKFSIDLKATSFEVSFRPQMNKFRKQSNEVFEPKIQEILEMSGGSKNDGNDLSLNLRESLNVRESCPSPMPSIQINMDDYETSSNDDDDENAGMTFYQDLMAQVNNMLENGSSCRNRIPAQKVYEVQEATLHYLKSMGVNLPSSEEIQPKCDKGLDYNPSEISFAVKQLLLKYLPEDHLAKIACRKADKPPKKISPPNGTEFSFATLQYMKKYNLINKKKPQFTKKITQQNQKSNDTSRILDISTLKLQPKLL